MKYMVGIDLGSTTTKAILLNTDGEIVGKGITNSRSNYLVASNVARNEALTSVKMQVFKESLQFSNIKNATLLYAKTKEYFDYYVYLF